MVFVLDDNLEIGAHVYSEIGNLISIRPVFKSAEAANLTLFSQKTFLRTVF